MADRICPECLGAKEIFNGTDAEQCDICHGTGSVDKFIETMYYGDEDSG